MDRACFEGIGPGTGILDDGHFDFVEVRAVFLEKIGISFAPGDNPRFKFGLTVSTGADPFYPLILARTGRYNGEMVVAGDKRKVGIAAAELENDPVFAVSLNISNLIDNSFGR